MAAPVPAVSGLDIETPVMDMGKPVSTGICLRTVLYKIGSRNIRAYITGHGVRLDGYYCPIQQKRALCKTIVCAVFTGDGKTFLFHLSLSYDHKWFIAFAAAEAAGSFF